MNAQNTDRPFQRTIPTLAIVMASVFITCHAYASEPESTIGEVESTITGLSKEQAQEIAKAREEQTAMSYTEKEQAAIDLAIGKVNQENPDSKDSVEHLRIRSVQWPDSSLGCPKPGVEYLQQVIPGYLVSFTANEKTYSVNIGDNNAIICDRIEEFLSARKMRGASVIKAHQAARLDLADKLMVDPEMVKVTKMKVETWPDSSLGCPVEGKQHLQEPVEGLIINMSCRDREYEYRVDLVGGDFISCKEIVSCHETE
ncbi:MAG: hypothetical protein QNK19_14310 [Xanthomonadales bacterium]|nr:hypothetical protein [Xanthomonadales bacterium]